MERKKEQEKEVKKPHLRPLLGSQVLLESHLLLAKSGERLPGRFLPNNSISQPKILKPRLPNASQSAAEAKTSC